MDSGTNLHPRRRPGSRPVRLARVVAVVLVGVVMAACSGTDSDSDSDTDADVDIDGSEVTAPAEVIGTLTFDGTTYELSRSDCEVGGDGLSRWFAFDADGDVELAVYEGDVDSLSLLVRDDHPDGPQWEQTEDSSSIDVDGDAGGLSGSATVTPVPLDGGDGSGEQETVEFELTC